MIKTLLIIVVIWLNPDAPHEIVDHIIFVSDAPSLGQCEVLRREEVVPWTQPEIGLFVWSWCVEARAP